VLDIVFVAVSILFFVVSIGYVAACDRLMRSAGPKGPALRD